MSLKLFYQPRAQNPCCLMQARDPIPQFRDWVLKEKILSEQQLSDIDKEVEATVEDSVQFADESPKPVSLYSCLALPNFG